MIRAKGITFGDGMREIRPVMDAYYALDALPVGEDPGYRKKDRKPRPVRRQRRAKKGRRQSMNTRELLIIASVTFPLILGLLFATVLLRHETVYILYMAAAYSWMTIVLYANCRRRRR